MHEQDEEACAGAVAGDGVGVGLLGGDGDDGAVGGGDERGGGGGVGGVPVERFFGADECEDAGDVEEEPEEEVAGDVGAGVEGAVEEEERQDVGKVPEGREAEGDEGADEVPDVVAVEPVVVGGVEVVGDVGLEDDLVG